MGTQVVDSEETNPVAGCTDDTTRERPRERRRCIIDHTDCAFFKRRPAYFFAEPSLKENQLANLRQAHAVVQEWFPHVEVNAYFAQGVDEHLVDFSRIV
jgi:hypothetical protein